MAAACLCWLPVEARGQSTLYYGGGTRTWSNAASWWQNYLGTLSATAAPGANDTAVFNTSGSNTSGTAVFTGDASLSRLLVLQTATGGLTLRGDGSPRTLTLGSGGIRVQSGNTSALTVGGTGTQAMQVALGTTQEWRLAGNALTVSGTVPGTSGTGATQTLFIGRAAGITGTAATFTDGAAGGRLNLWLNSSADVVLSPSNSIATSGVLTLQNSGASQAFLGSDSSTSLNLATVGELQLAGGGLARNARLNVSLNPSGTIRVLGGASTFFLSSVISNAGTFVRSPGGGILAVPTQTTTGTGLSATAVNGLLPWVMGGNNNATFYRVSGTTLAQASLTSVNNPNSLPPVGSGSANNNYHLSFSTAALTASREASSVLFAGGLASVMDLGQYSLTLNGFGVSTGVAATISASEPGGYLGIGPSGELVMWFQGGSLAISAPVRESTAGGWLTLGIPSTNQGLFTGAFTLSGSNSHSGGTSILSRGINLNHAFALGSGTFRIGGNAIVLDNTSTAPLTIATNNLHEWNSDFSFGGTQDLNLGTGTVSLGTWAGSIRTVTVNAGSLTVGGRIENGTHVDLPTTGVAKDGPGTLILTGSNGYTGVTESWGGELRFANRNALYGADTSKWVPANFTTGTMAVISVSVGDQAGAFTSADLDILDGAVGGPIGGYLGIDTTGAISGTYTYATNIAAPAGDRVLGIAKTGVGTLVLTGSNTFTGGVLAREGRLLVTNANQVGPGTLVAAGGLLDMSGLTVSNAFSITSGTIANTAVDAAKFTAAVTGPAVFSGTLTGAGANGNWTKSGTSTLVLSASNTLTGTTTLTGGLLSISSDANLNGTASALVFNGGGLQVTGAALTSLATGRSTTFTSGQSVRFDIADPANTFTVTQNLQHGNAGLTMSGAGTLVASGNNTFTGDVVVAGGTLRMGSATGLMATSTGAITTSGGVLDLNGNPLTRSGVLTLAGGGVTGGTLTVTGPSIAGSAGTVTADLIGTGTVALLKSGTGLLVLSGSTTYPGNTTIGGGILQFGRTTALYGGTTGNWIRTKITGSSGATLAVNVGGAGEFQPSDVTTLLTGVSGTVTSNGLLSGAFIGFDTTNSGTAFTLADPVADTTSTGGGAIGLRKLGSGTLVLSASNTFTGATQVGYAGGPTSGVMQLASTGHVSPTVTIFGGTFDTAGQNRSITTLTLGAGGAGSTASLQTGSGTAMLGGNVTFTETNNPAGATIGGNLSLGNAARTFAVGDSTAAAADLTVSAVISSTGASGGIVKTGSGTLTLTGSNSFAAKTQINEGVVQIDWINSSGNSPLGANTTTDLGSSWRNGTLRWVGATSGTTSRTFNLSGTSGGGIEASGAGALVISSTVTATGAGAKTFTLGGTGTAANTIGTILNGSGTTSVVKDGPGLWRIAAGSSYTGSFTVRNGTLVAAVDSVGNATGAFGGSTSPLDVVVGDSSPTASGTASLLLAAGFNTNKVMNVLGGGGSQAVILGGEGGTVDFQGDLYLGRAVTLVAGPSGTTFFSGAWKGLSGTGALGANVTFGSSGNTGMVTVSRGLATSGSVGVRFGTLNLGTTGTVAAGAPLGIDAGATLAGIGFVTGTLGGAGLVAPGNSPGILTAGAVDPSGGLDWAFEFTNATPDYTSSSNSLNDILRLTGTAPFTTSLTPANEIAVYLDVASLADGNTFRGGFFTDQPGAFASTVAAATYTYWVSGSGAGQTTYQTKTYVPLASLYPSLSMGVTTVSDTAAFSGGSPTSGQVMQFTVVVPEPGTLALAALGLGLAGAAFTRGRRRGRGSP